MDHARAENWTIDNAHESLVQAMLDPGFYPKPPAEVTRRETHISDLFFAGELVFKVKKAVRYSFLDYSTLKKRRFFLQEELRLNRRLAPSVYIGVMPITFDDLGWRLGGWAEPAEYVLVMRRLPDKRMLPSLLETEQVTPSMMRELAEFLVGFHRAAERVTGIAPQRYAAIVQKQWNDNLADLEPFIGELFDAESFSAIQKFAANFIEQHAELFARRAEQGWIRDVHGDLHAEHICFAPEGIQIFDCIEFDPRLRHCDLASEIAFLLMDVEMRGGKDLLEPFLLRYRELIDDPEGGELLPFWRCYRALVRAKVYALRGEGGIDMARRYFFYAARIVWQRLRPFIVMVSGLTGSGKSTLARGLSERTGMALLQSDMIRKEIAGRSGRQPAPYSEGIYSPTMTEKTYTTMARRAGRLLAQGMGVIVDATFGRRAQREKIIRFAEKHRIAAFMIHCSVDEETVQTRLAQREAEGKDVSDGRWEIYLKQREAFEEIGEIPADARLELNTDAPVDLLISGCEKFLRARLAPQ
jgi:aminoglycoside phosphotransferase family enzyme/predicted kinase